MRAGKWERTNGSGMRREFEHATDEEATVWFGDDARWHSFVSVGDCEEESAHDTLDEAKACADAALRAMGVEVE